MKDIVGGGLGEGGLGVRGYLGGRGRGWENGSRGCALAKVNHVQGSHSKYIRKAINGLPRGF